MKKYFTILLSCLVSFSTLGNTFQDGKKAFYGFDKTDVNYDVAFKKLNSIENKNDPELLNMLGAMYRDGKGTEKNQEKALEYFTKSAEKGSSLGMLNVSEMHLMREGVKEPNFELAFKYANLAAQKGLEKGYYYIGMMHIIGEYVEQDFQKGYEYLLKSYETNKDISAFTIGRLHLDNKIKGANREDAIKYLTIASEEEFYQAERYLGDIYSDTSNQGYHFSNNEKAFKHYKKCSDKTNDSYCQLNLSGMYFYGAGIKPDLEKAYLWAYVSFINEKSDPASDIIIKSGAKLSEETKIQLKVDAFNIQSELANIKL